MSLSNFKKPKSTGKLIFSSVFPVLVLVLGLLLYYFFQVQSSIIEKTQKSLEEKVTKGTLLLIKNYDLSLRLSEEQIEKKLKQEALKFQSKLNTIDTSAYEAYLNNQKAEFDWYILSPKLVIVNSNIKTEIGFDLGKVAGKPTLSSIVDAKKTNLPTSNRSALEKSSNKAKKYVYIVLKNGFILELGQYLPDTELIQANLMESINKINKKFPQVKVLQLYYGEGLKRSINKVDFLEPEVQEISEKSLDSGKDVTQKIGSNIHVFNLINMDQSHYNEKWLMHLVFSTTEKEILLWKCILQFLVILALTTFLIYIILKRNLKTYTQPLDQLVFDTEKLISKEVKPTMQLTHSTDIDVLKYNFNLLFDSLLKEKSGLEVKVQQRTENLEMTNKALASSLKQQEMMFKEVHHRVKNNLQIISSLLNLQSSQLEENIPAYEAFQESINRVSAIGLFHEKMYKSKQLESLDLCDFLNELVAFIIAGMPKPMEYKIDCNHVMVKSENAVTIALIMNELLINSSKHGYPTGNHALVSIELKMENEETIITYSDNGKGLPKDFDVTALDTLGMTIIDAFCEKLDAPYTMKNGEENGVIFSCSFKNLIQVMATH
jgi:two-component sensor histidine kinase